MIVNLHTPTGEHVAMNESDSDAFVPLDFVADFYDKRKLCFTVQ